MRGEHRAKNISVTRGLLRYREKERGGREAERDTEDGKGRGKERAREREGDRQT